jgi:hypothetical protein
VQNVLTGGVNTEQARLKPAKSGGAVGFRF